MHSNSGFRYHFIGMLLLVWTVAPAFADFGPLQTVNRFPLHLMFLKPRPVDANLPRQGELEAAFAVEYSNTYYQEQNNHWDVLIDMEMMVVDLSMVYGIAPKLAFRLDMPFVSMNDGFLDGFLGNYHDFIGVGNYDREDRPGDTFGYRVSKDGELWIDGHSGALQGADVTVSIQYALTGADDRQAMASALLLSIKAPTGNEALGIGSGANDLGLYWPTQWAAKPWSFYVMPSIALIGDPHTLGADVSARNSYGIFGGAAYDYSERLTLLAQLIYYSSPIEETGISSLDDGTLGLDVGFHYQLKNDWIFEFAFCEDLTRAAPDFNLRLGVRRAFKGL